MKCVLRTKGLWLSLFLQDCGILFCLSLVSTELGLNILTSNRYGHMLCRSFAAKVCVQPEMPMICYCNTTSFNQD